MQLLNERSIIQGPPMMHRPQLPQLRNDTLPAIVRDRGRRGRDTRRHTGLIDSLRQGTEGLHLGTPHDHRILILPRPGHITQPTRRPGRLNLASHRNRPHTISVQRRRTELDRTNRRNRNLLRVLPLRCPAEEPRTTNRHKPILERDLTINTFSFHTKHGTRARACAQGGSTSQPQGQEQARGRKREQPA